MRRDPFGPQPYLLRIAAAREQMQLFEFVFGDRDRMPSRGQIQEKPLFTANSLAVRFFEDCTKTRGDVEEFL